MYGLNGLEVPDSSAKGTSKLPDYYNNMTDWVGKSLEIPVYFNIKNTVWEIIYKLDTKAGNDRMAEFDIFFMSGKRVVAQYYNTDAWSGNSNVASSVRCCDKDLYTAGAASVNNGLELNTKLVCNDNGVQLTVNNIIQNQTVAITEDYLIDKIAICVMASTNTGHPQGYANVRKIEIQSI